MDTIEPFISNDPTKHRFNITLRGKVFPFLACRDDEYYLRIAAKIINEKAYEVTHTLRAMLISNKH